MGWNFWRNCRSKYLLSMPCVVRSDSMMYSKSLSKGGISSISDSRSSPAM